MDNRLKELRKSTGVSQKDFYSKVVKDEIGMDISFRTYQNWEKPSNTIKEENAIKLADYFNVSIGFLLGFGTKEEEVTHEKKRKKEKFLIDKNRLLEFGYLLSDSQLENIIQTIQLFHTVNNSWIRQKIDFNDDFLEHEFYMYFNNFAKKYPNYLEEEKLKLDRYNDDNYLKQANEKWDIIKKFHNENNSKID
ncbi:helix-turn-helix domain-containing protein [Streptococcus uberis]|uniref:helix-turn-helix domain-containing protein n=1 Tax=Streptococcus uberis TaxID=1349 RepID=UPI00062299EC|nr:helix-turn-helix transcriptional regulator [Streptococcus uberis]KKF45235.1 XRE family transcriptional regulator [Streptococcus uberis EF20/0145]QBX12132.1 hypothetical protein JavanS635_0016 [Streptococcus satellite phage Javan635]